MAYNSGDNVYAKWRGSSLYYPAKIKNKADGDNYTVVFDDGSEDDLRSKNIRVSLGSNSLQVKPSTSTWHWILMFYFLPYLCLHSFECSCHLEAIGVR